MTLNEMNNTQQGSYTAFYLPVLEKQSCYDFLRVFYIKFSIKRRVYYHTNTQYLVSDSSGLSKNVKPRKTNNPTIKFFPSLGKT